MKIISFLFLLLMMVSCGDSPLLNHSMEGSGLTGERFRSTSEEYKFVNSKYSFSTDWVTGPLKGENKLIVKTWKTNESTFNGPFEDVPHNLHIYLWMPDMGHGSAPVKIKKIAPGEYEVTNVYIIMGGAWDLHFQILKNEAVIDEAVIRINL